MSTSSASSGNPGIYSSELVDQAVAEHLADARFADGTDPVNGSADVELGAEPSEAPPPSDGRVAGAPVAGRVAATSSVSAEAQQGDGPAAAGASASGVSESVARTSAVSVVIGPDGAAATCDFGVGVAGPHGAAAASQAGVAAVGRNGAASSSNAANATSAAVDGAVERQPDDDILERLLSLERESRELRSRLS
jgi:hypothetical protein